MVKIILAYQANSKPTGHTWNPVPPKGEETRETEAGRSPWVLGLPGLQNKLQARKGFVLRPCLRKEKNVKERPNSLNRIKLPKCETIINKRPLWRIWSTQKYQEWWDAFLCKRRSLKKEVSYALVNVRPSHKIFGKSQESKYTNTFTSPHLPPLPLPPIKLSFLWKLRFELGYTHGFEPTQRLSRENGTLLVGTLP